MRVISISRRILWTRRHAGPGTPVIQQNSATLEPFGQLFGNGLFMTEGPAKASSAHYGSADLHVHQHSPVARS